MSADEKNEHACGISSSWMGARNMMADWIPIYEQEMVQQLTGTIVCDQRTEMATQTYKDIHRDTHKNAAEVANNKTIIIQLFRLFMWRVVCVPGCSVSLIGAITNNWSQWWYCGRMEYTLPPSPISTTKLSSQFDKFVTPWSFCVLVERPLYPEGYKHKRQWAKQ